MLACPSSIRLTDSELRLDKSIGTAATGTAEVQMLVGSLGPANQLEAAWRTTGAGCWEPYSGYYLKGSGTTLLIEAEPC